MPLDYDNMNKSLAGIENMQMAAPGSRNRVRDGGSQFHERHDKPGNALQRAQPAMAAVLQNAPLPAACAASAIDRHGSRVMIARVFARISG